MQTQSLVSVECTQLQLSSRLHAYDLGNEELQILNTRDGLLNDICINGLPALLQALFIRDPRHHNSASRCVVFSTYDLYRIRYKASDAELWRSTYRREFWSKAVWIIPIHRRTENHWVMAVLHLERREVHLYDSFGRRPAWHQDVQVCFFYKLYKFSTP